MAAGEIHKNDIGVQFLVTVYSGSTIKDISAFTTKQYIFRKPSGAFITVTADFYTDGSDGVLSYISSTGVLNESGIWKLQIYLANTNNSKKSDIGSFIVHENLE